MTLQCEYVSDTQQLHNSCSSQLTWQYILVSVLGCILATYPVLHVI